MFQVMISNLYPTFQSNFIDKGSEGSVHKLTKGNQTLALKIYNNSIDQDEK